MWARGCGRPGPKGAAKTGEEAGRRLAGGVGVVAAEAAGGSEARDGRMVPSSTP